MVVIPNSVVSRAIVTNHSRPKGPHRCTLRLTVDLAVTPSRVIEGLIAAATGSADVSPGTIPQAYACAFSDSLVDYELAFAIDSFALTPGAKSEMLSRVADAFRRSGIHIGPMAMDVRMVQQDDLAAANGVPQSAASPQPNGS